MRKRLIRNRRTVTLIAVMVPLLALFAYTALSSGPLAPTQVITTEVARETVTPTLFLKLRQSRMHS